MSGTTRLGMAAMGTALALGLLGDGLLRTLPWGINLPLWIAVLFAAVVGLARWGGVSLTGGGRWLAGPAVLLALGPAWRDSATLTLFNMLALGGLLAMLALRGRTGRLVVGGITTWALAPFVSWFYATAGPLALAAGPIHWPELPRGSMVRTLLAGGLGLAIATPLLLIFGGLFAAADAAFEHLFAEIVRWFFTELLVHLVMTAVVTWGVAGLLHQLLFGREMTDLVGPRPAVLGLGVIELSVVLGLLDALFATFVALQLPYLFGGAALVTASPTLTYAEYARRGFFELVTVVALALPLLLLFDWLRRADHSQATLIFRLLAGLMIGLLLLVTASALQRMWLYTAVYGLTELRVYTTAVMVWLTVVCLWFAATILPGWRERFAVGAVISALATLVVLNMLNPDALIVSANAGRIDAAQPISTRPATGRIDAVQSFDARYVTSLSADAVPALVAALPVLRDDERHTVATTLLRRWETTAEPDWRSWNWSRWVARQTVESAAQTLREIAASTAPNPPMTTPAPGNATRRPTPASSPPTGAGR